MTEEKDTQPFMSALVTEHFVLQSVASSTIGESGSRAALYLSALSSGLVAVGFASSDASTLRALVFSVFPTLFLLGCFTIVRLVDTSVENIVSLRRIALIRKYYAALHPDAAQFFGDPGGQNTFGLRYRSWSVLFTMASMVIVVNSVLGGAAIASVGGLALALPIPAATAGGALSGLVILSLSLLYQRRRLTPLIALQMADSPDATELDESPGGSASA